MTTPTTIQPHDSSTCRLSSGQPCELCVWAIEQERNRIVEQVHELMADDCDCPQHRTEKLDHDHAQRILTAIANDGKFASLTTIRAAIMDVIDVGCRHGDELRHEWRFDHVDESFANEQRCDFVDAVCQRIAQLQAPPHNFDSIAGKGE